MAIPRTHRLHPAMPLRPSGPAAAPARATSTASVDSFSAPAKPLGQVHVRSNHRIDPGSFEGGHVTGAHAHAGRVQAFAFKAKMDIDSDGGHVSLARDPWHQNDTSLHLGGKPVDAVHIPYIVLPPPLAAASGAKLGDLAQVSYHGHTVYAVYADVGPSSKLGEGSMALAKALGINNDPKNGGLQSPQVHYTVLPGSRHFLNEHRRPTPADIQRAGRAAFLQARTRGWVR